MLEIILNDAVVGWYDEYNSI